MDQLSLHNPLFVTYVIAATLMILKAVSMSWLTVVRMLQENGGFRSPEDLRKTPLNPAPDARQLERNERVERIRRIHQNDLENVPAFLTSPQWDVFQDELESGMLADYEIEVDILNAADYGAVQARKRVIVIGHHKDLPAPGLPTKTHEHQHRTLDEIFQDIPNTVDRIGLPEGTIEYGGVDRPGAFATRELHFGRFYTDLSLKRFASIPEKGNRFDLPDELLAPCWRKHRTGTADVMGRLHLDKPSVTIRTEFFKPEKGRYLHPTEDRAITHYEAALIQGFPENYQWVGTREEIARQIGNAVPIPLGKAIGRQLQTAFSGRLDAPEESEASRAA